MAPNGWLKTDLNPYIDIKHGFAFKSEYFREEGEYVLLTPGSFYEPGGFRDQKSKTKYYVGDIPKGYLLSKGELLVAMTEQAAGLLGSTLFVPSHDRYLHNQRLGLIQIKDKNGICPEFLYLTYNSQYVRKQIAEQSTGTKVKHTSPDKLKSVICLLPPLPEQRKIAKILSTWDKAISATERLIDNSKQQKKALMQQLLTGKKRLLDDSGKSYDSEWRFSTFSELFKVANNKKTQVKASEYLSEGKTPIVDQGKQLISGYTNNDEKYTELPVIIFGDHTRVVKWVNFAFAQGADGTQVLKNTKLLNDKYAYYLLSDTDIPNLGYSRHMRELKEKDFKYPTDIREQERVASVLTNADKEIDLLEQQLADLKQEKKALMQQLLTGKRRVKI
tara:strand:+ start:9081 stop:10247 length:1167 start_codon:yes stop_codon:yes gene_type:complete